MVLRPSDRRCSKFPARGKLLRYIPGATWSKFGVGPTVGDGGALSSTEAKSTVKRHALASSARPHVLCNRSIALSATANREGEILPVRTTISSSCPFIAYALMQTDTVFVSLSATAAQSLIPRATLDLRASFSESLRV